MVMIMLISLGINTENVSAEIRVTGIKPCKFGKVTIHVQKTDSTEVKSCPTFKSVLSKYCNVYRVYNARQATLRRIAYSEFITHSLVHLYNLQSRNYCHLQYYKYFSRSHFYTLNNNGLHS
jgi:hypothetical protein